MPITYEKNKWRARVQDGDERVSLGMFDTKRKAQYAVARWKRKNEFPDSWRLENNIMTFEDIPMNKTKDKMKPKKSLYKPEKNRRGIGTRIKDKYEDFMEWLEKQIVQ